MKNILLTFLFGTFSWLALSQQNWCGFDAHNQKLNAENPGREQAIHEQIVRITHGTAPMMDRSDPIIIPVVVHVIHKGDHSNISNEQIQSGIDMLNEDFNRMNADSADTRDLPNAPFEQVAANVGIQFELAKIDPDGNCTNGIQRRYSPSVSDNADNNAKHYNSGGLDAWNRNDYMNIWIVNSIASDGEGITLGYAEFPYSGGSSNYGVIIRHDAYGSVGTASGDRTLTHEIGHCLGLMHTFQGSCHNDDCTDNGDYCCDTPPESEAHWSCGSSQNSCNDVPVNDFFGADVFDQWENFMSYAPCQNMFSNDQKNIMLYNLSEINFLSNLTSLSNQAEAGIGQPAVLCKAEFSSSTTVICAGSSITFSDDSYFNVTDRTWNFSGGTPAVSTLENPVVTYNTPGIYDISLQATDGISTVSTLANDYVIVLPGTGEPVPYSEGFESFTTFPDNQAFFVENDNVADTWELFSGAAYSGSKCLKLKNIGETDGSKDAFISGTIDLSGVDNSEVLIFNFRYAYRKRAAADDEWLQIFVSNDCGESWSLRKNIHGSQLSELAQPSAYQPASAAEWNMIEITTINPDYYVSNFRYKIVFTNDDGNNMYIDNINIYPASMAAVTEVESPAPLTVYPNPAADQIHVSYAISNAEMNGEVTVENALGQVVQYVHSGTIPAGSNTWPVDIAAFESGVYFIRVKSDAGNQVIKFIKE